MAIIKRVGTVVVFVGSLLVYQGCSVDYDSGDISSGDKKFRFSVQDTTAEPDSGSIADAERDSL